VNRSALAAMAILLYASSARAEYSSVVTGTRTEEPVEDAAVATEVIGRDELDASGADTVAEALAAHVGVQVDSGLAGEVVSLQGLDPEYTLVLVDGQRVIGRVGGGLDLARLPIADVERIEIVKGPASALYGSDAIGGVVNVVTRHGRRELDAEGHATYGTFGQLETRARVGGGVGPWRLAASGGWQRGDGWDADASTVATTASASDTYHAGVDAAFRPTGSAWRGDAGVRWMQRDQHGVDQSGAGAIFDRRNLTETLDATVAPEWKPTLATRLRLTGHYGWFRDQFVNDQRDSDALDQYQDTREQLAEATLQLDWLAGDHLASFGADGMFEALRSQRLADGDGDRARGAVFAQDEWTLARAPRLVLVPAVRLDEDTRFGTHVTPRLAARFDPREDVVVRASIGTGYRAPDFKELYLHFENPGVGYVVDGNEDLDPETSRSVTAGVEWRPTDRLWLSGGLFRHDLSDLIEATLEGEPAPGETQRFRYHNVDAATSQGAELAARFTPWTPLRLEASYAFTDARDDADDEPLAGRARHRGTFAVTWRPLDGRLEAYGRASLVGRRPYGDQRADRYALVDVRAAWRLGDRFRVFAGLDNLLDAGDAGLNPIQPRTVYAGASATY
jgi:outer membrane receptor for ferrienterochelin and colicins